MKKKVIIMGAAGRDFHNFNMVFRNNKNYKVVCFTATQIPRIAGRSYPKILAGRGYPKGIPIYPEDKLSKLITDNKIDIVALSYSDLSHEEVMHKASIVNASGADFWLLGPTSTMLKSKKPVVSICAVRTGAGKSPTSRATIDILKRLRPDIRIVVIRHPMPYGQLSKQAVQRFQTFEDLKKANTTIEEMEEYLPHIERGTIVYAGVDYEKILRSAEKEADIILWDGGNNDLPFIKPDLHIVLADARRPGHEVMYYPGEANFRMADAIIVNKIAHANPDGVDVIINNAKELNPKATLVKADMTISLDGHLDINRKRVLVVEDGPTVTHGGLANGAGALAAEKAGAYTVNPRQYAVGSLKRVYEKYPHLGAVLPAMGYFRAQLDELERTINSTPCDAVVIGTPVDLRRVLNINKPAVRVTYDLKIIGKPDIEDILREFLRRGKLK